MSFNLIASESKDIDNKEVINGVDLISGKTDSKRFYKGTIEQEFDTTPQQALEVITDFEQRCNNEYSDDRKLQKNVKCKYFNNNLIESVIHPDITVGLDKKAGEIRRFLVSRRIYNRSHFSHTDLIQVFKKKTDGKDVYTLTQKMISEKEVKKYMKPIVETDSVFLKADAIYTLIPIKANKTKITFQYKSKTDHWLLNKSISVGRVFDSMSKTLNGLFSSLKSGLKMPKTTKLSANKIQ
jgi:hypothetical protein